jgi:hypothetical protein
LNHHNIDREQRRQGSVWKKPRNVAARKERSDLKASAMSRIAFIGETMGADLAKILNRKSNVTCFNELKRWVKAGRSLPSNVDLSRNYTSESNILKATEAFARRLLQGGEPVDEQRMASVVRLILLRRESKRARSIVDLRVTFRHAAKVMKLPLLQEDNDLSENTVEEHLSQEHEPGSDHEERNRSYSTSYKNMPSNAASVEGSTGNSFVQSEISQAFEDLA